MSRCGYHGFCQSAGIVHGRPRRFWQASGQRASASWQQKEKIAARRNMTREQACGFFSWCTQQCSTASAREEVAMQSRVSGWHMWWRTSSRIGVSWYHVTGCSGQPWHGRHKERRTRPRQQATLFIGAVASHLFEAACHLVVSSSSRPTDT